MSHESLFVGPKLKIQRARKHIADIREISDQFGNGLLVHVIPVGETEFHSHYTLKYSKTPPIEISIIIGDAVHNLRSALDLMLSDVARIREKNPKGMKFPFAASAEAFELLIEKGRYSQLGTDITELLRLCAPYRGGNAGLRGMHDLDITDKHNTIIPSYVAAWGEIVFPEFAKDLSTAFGFDFSQMRAPFCEGSSITVAKGIDPVSTMVLAEGPPEPLFPSGTPFPMEPVIAILDQLVLLVDDIVEAFADRCREKTIDGSSLPSED